MKPHTQHQGGALRGAAQGRPAFGRGGRSDSRARTASFVGGRRQRMVRKP